MANNEGVGRGKQSNPKDVVGSKKLSIGLVPDTIDAYVSLAFLEGALKYGRYNWRFAGVRASIYHDALRRHLAKWWNGEDAAQDTRVRHLASIIACAGILLDAELCGMLTDDRPPAAPGIVDLLDKELIEVAAHLREMFKDHSPHQFSIADTLALGRADEAREQVHPAGAQTGTGGGGGEAVLREDEQSLPQRDSGCVVFGEPQRLVGRVQVDRDDAKAWPSHGRFVSTAEAVDKKPVY